MPQHQSRLYSKMSGYQLARLYMNHPQRLYKYRSLAGNNFRRTQQIVLRNELYFSPLEALNDPSEGQNKLDLPVTTPSGFTEKIVNGIFHLSIDFLWHQPLKNSGVLSLSKKGNDILMWSHYADKHCGICLEFNVESDFFRNAKPIQYSDIFEGLIDIKGLKTPEDWQKKMEKIFLIKAKQWAYEEEWRVIDAKSGVKSFPPSALTAIILGCRISGEDRQWINNWIRLRGENIRLFQARLREADFGVDIVPVSQPA